MRIITTQHLNMESPLLKRRNTGSQDTPSIAKEELYSCHTEDTTKYHSFYNSDIPIITRRIDIRTAGCIVIQCQSTLGYSR